MSDELHDFQIIESYITEAKWDSERGEMVGSTTVLVPGEEPVTLPLLSVQLDHLARVFGIVTGKDSF